ncbi:MAG: transposase [Bryobacterales bacterium]|nr:transposase [Bryobacterales bacterium]
MATPPASPVRAASEKATHDSVPFRYLAADQHPDHDTIANFRRQHLEELAKLFVQALQLCRKAGLVKLGNVAIDGTKIKANASFARGKTHTKMSEEEQKLGELVKQWMADAERSDAEDDARLGKGNKEERSAGEIGQGQPAAGTPPTSQKGTGRRSQTATGGGRTRASATETGAAEEG